MDQVSVKWKSKFEAVKINSKLDIVDKLASKSIVFIAFDNNLTLSFNLDNFHITMKYLECAPADGSYVCTCKNWSGGRQKRIAWLTFSCSETEVLYKNQHTVLWSANGLASLNSKFKKGHPLRLRRWPEQLAISFLCRASVRTSDFRFAERTFLDFSNSLSLDMLTGYFF